MNRVEQSVRRLLLLVLALCVVFGGVAQAKTRKTARPKPAPAVDKDNSPEAGAIRATPIKPEQKAAGGNDDDKKNVPAPGHRSFGPPTEWKLTKATGSGKKLDLRRLPHTPPPARERVELEGPEPAPVAIDTTTQPHFETGFQPPFVANTAAPPPNAVYEGLDRFNWGAGSPPDTNGDVGPNDYIQTVNTSIGVYRKSDGFQEAAFTFNTLMSQGNFGNLCDTNNFGDPVVLYDTFEDRWVITDFAFLTDINGNVLAPAYECFAVSLNGNPVTGGWNFYSIQITDNLNDYPKLGVWPDGIYMSANMFSFGAGSSFKGARVWAFNKAQMYAGSPTVKMVSFDVGGGDFAVMPSNARLQTGTPPAGRPNLFIGTWQFLNALTVYKFHVDWNNISLSTFTGPDVPLAATSWPNASVANVPQSGTSQLLDALQIRAMVQNQYTNFGGVESLWIPHTVRRANTSGFAAPRWYQVDVSGGTVAANLPQATTWDPDAANVMHRWMPSLALDRAGNMAMGYSTSSSSTFPSIKYAGRLAADPVNTFSLTEQTFFTGTASQLSSTRWGDYSSMTLDPDGCTFWYTTEYATGLDNTTVDPTSFNKRWQTKFGSIGPFSGCTPVGAGGTVSGAVTTNPGGSPIPGATVNLGARSTTTDGSGNYSFTGIPAGTYPSMTAAMSGAVSASASGIVVTDGNTTTQNFSLASAPASACATDTTQSDFFTASAQSNVDLNASPGDVTLSNAPVIDQQNTAGTTTGTGFGTPAWTGQTFIAGVTGQLVKADVQLFCNGCGATPPNLTLSVRATSGGLPTGADLASVTIPGSTFASGATTLYTATFGSPATLTSGTQYALILRPVSAPAGSGYFWIRSSPSTYANGSRVLSADSGATWSADTTRDYNYKTYMQTGYAPSGNLVSSPKDANPTAGLTPIWSTLSWNATVPANTSVKFQVAGSNNVNGPFNFVGPDGTAGTFFTTSPVQLQPQFYNFRYLEYKAILATTDSAQTPTLSDVTMCFNDVDCSGTPTITPGSSQACSNSTGNTADGPAGATSYSWSITNGAITAGSTSQTVTYTAGSSGTVGLILNVVLPNGCQQSNSVNVNIVATPAAPTIDGADGAYCTGSVMASSLADSYQWYKDGNLLPGETNQTLTITQTGAYTVTATIAGCTSAQSTARNVTSITTVPTTPTISADTNGTGTQDQACPEVPLTLHANGATGADSYQWYKDIDLLPGETNSTYQATGAATYYVVGVNSCGNSTQSAGYVVQNPTPHSPFISFRNQDSSVTTLSICQGTSQIIDSDSATGIQWYKDGIAIPVGGNNQSYTATQAGVYTAQLNALGCHSQFGRNVTITVDAMPPTPTISGDTNGTGTQDQACPEQPLTLHANGATGATSYTWYTDNAVVPNENTSTLVVTYVANISVTATNGSCTTPHSATYVVQNPTPHAPFISFRNQSSTVTSLSICAGQSQIIDSDSATGIQWYKDGVAIPVGGNSQSYTATQSGVYTAQLNALGCHSQFGRNVTLTVNPLPATPTANAGGPTTFCAGGSVTLTSSSTTGNQWYLNGNPLGGATNQTYGATASGSYTVKVTDGNGCTSAASNAISVTVNPLPATPTINAGGPTSFCAGGSVTLTSSSASGNQWYLNGNPLGATGTTYNATAAGNYTVTTTDGNGCTSAASAPTTVTVNPLPNAAITAASAVTQLSTGNAASVANAGAGATYNWGITNGTITGGTGTASMTFTAGATGTLTINVTVTTSAGCSDVKSTNLTVTPAVTVTSVSPVAGPYFGGQPVTVNGTGFLSGATVTFGGTAATNVVVVSSTMITVKTPAHSPGAVNVVVTNTNTTSGTLTNGYTYQPQIFDPNGDGVVDPSDIFFLVNYLYLNGPAPHGTAGMPQSGDANRDGTIDPADIFYVVNYLFGSGPSPWIVTERPASESLSEHAKLSGALLLGDPQVREGRTFVPVLLAMNEGSQTPQAFSLVVRGGATIRRSGATEGLKAMFEVSRATNDSVAFVLSLDPQTPLVLGADRSAVIAEIEVADAASRLTIDGARTMLSNSEGTRSATVSNGMLHLDGERVIGASKTESKGMNAQ